MLAVQSYIPLPTSSGLTNNYLPSYSNQRVSQIPSVKIDHSLSSRLKLSGYWARTQTDSPNNAGLPYPISNTVGNHIVTDTYRVNIDYTWTPTLLLHVGGGYLFNRSDPDVPRFDNSKIGFKGTNADLFPFFSVLSVAQGGMANMGPPSDFRIKNLKPTSTASLTWVHNNHTYKAGGELIVKSVLRRSAKPILRETMLYSPNQTGLPALDG